MSRTPASSIPAAIAGLLTVLQADSALSDVTITDGPQLVEPSLGRAELRIGSGGDAEDTLSASSQLGDSSLRRGDSTETVELRCHVEYWLDGEPVQPCRTVVFAVVDAVKAALVRDPTLGGAVRRSRLTGELTYSAGRLENGTGVETGAAVAFTVRADAL